MEEGSGQEMEKEQDDTAETGMPEFDQDEEEAPDNDGLNSTN